MTEYGTSFSTQVYNILSPNSSFWAKHVIKYGHATQPFTKTRVTNTPFLLKINLIVW
jgi:hypothetical protein